MDNLSAEHTDLQHLSPVNVNFSIPLNVAIAIVAGRHTAAELQRDALRRNEQQIRQLAGRVRLHHDWSMSLVVADAFDASLGPAGVLASLSWSELRKVALSYQKEMGGRHKHSLRLSGMFRHFGDLLNRARSVRRHRGQDRDLGQVDFTTFRMAFPARVAITTRDGRTWSARQDVPLGAPGLEGRAEAVIAKVRQEAGPTLGAKCLNAALACLEGRVANLAELAKAFCRP